MKRFSLFLVFSLVCLFSISISAQEEETASANNFFIGAGVNGNVWLNDRGSKDFGDVWSKPTLGGSLFVGKWFNDKWGARINVEGGSLHSYFKNELTRNDPDDLYYVKEKYVLGRLDLLLNLTNVFRSYSPDRFYNLIPHVGVGGAYAFNGEGKTWNVIRKDSKASVLVGAGLLNTFRLSCAWSAFIDLKMDLVDAELDGCKTDDAFLNTFDGLLSPSIGLIYNFGRTCKQKEKVAPPVFVEPVVPVKEVPCPPCPTCPEPPKPQPQVVAPAPFPYNVFFRIDKWVIDPSQQIALEKTANYMKAYPNTKIKVLGHADVKTAYPAYNLKLSEKRAKNVARELVEKYGISSDRITIDWRGDTVQPFEVNELNRVVIILEN